MESIKNEKKQNILIYITLFLSSIVLLLLFNGDSPLYFFNMAPDNTVYKTVAQRMLRGEVLYREIYEHKGLYLYFYYMIKEFIHPFVVELILDLIFVFTAYQTMHIFQNKKNAFLCTLFINVADKSFGYLYHFGGQSETIGRVILMLLIYMLIRNYYIHQLKDISFQVFFITGILTMILFMIKYTMMIFVVSFAFTLLITALKEHTMKYYIRCFGIFLSGFAAGFIPALIYFIKTGSMKSFIQIYLFDVSLQYDPAKFNISPIVFVALIVLFVLIAKKSVIRPIDMLIVSCLASLIFTAIATRIYYFGMYMPFLTIAFIALDDAVQHAQLMLDRSSRTGRILIGVLYIGVLIALPVSFSANMRFMTEKGFSNVAEGCTGSLKEVVDIINSSPDKTLLTRSDSCVLYLMTNTLPDTKYFINYNMVLEQHSTAYALSSYKEKKNYVNDAFNQYIDDGTHEFVFQYACNYINHKLYDKVGTYCINGNYGKLEVMVLYQRK